MGKYRLVIEQLAEEDLKKHKKIGNKATIRKISKILEELEETPYSGVGQPEMLKYDLKGFWSRRINQKDRIIYVVQENIVTVIVASAMGHYDDK